MVHYIGIDGSKKVLNVFDGEKDLVFDNEDNLSYLKKYFRERYADLGFVVILFEETGIYSFSLKRFCALSPSSGHPVKTLSLTLTFYIPPDCNNQERNVICKSMKKRVFDVYFQPPWTNLV